ncbi:hypothetical protein OIV83_006203 [Microbotryomycetes sp. JL201]|nr:hypothetical protein OIV83_006203 [Microbotryomycetes sp. JL201]
MHTVYPTASTSQLPLVTSLPKSAILATASGGAGKADLVVSEVSNPLYSVGASSQSHYDDGALPSRDTSSGPAAKKLTKADELDGISQVADKSCHRCRLRKVKCDRRWPKCNKCSKRREKCEWNEEVSLSLQVGKSRSSKAMMAEIDISDVTPPKATSELFTRISSGSLSKPPGQTDLTSLWDSFLKSNIGERSIDWQLARPAMASSLTLHLLEASQHSCCFHLPAFHTFANRLSYLKTNLSRLDIQGEVIVAILASLGARASPHSALIGVAGPDFNITQVQPSKDFLLTAGTRRESAWRALADRATSLCSRPEILQLASKDNIEILVACIQMLMLSKVKPVKSRFFLRNVTGMFEDIQRMDVSPAEILRIKQSVGRTLYECDARVAAYSNSPLFITDDDIAELFHGTGIVLPDLERDGLANALDQVFEGPLAPKQIEDALALTGFWVCALQRTYARISSSRSPNFDFLHSVPQLWKWIDNAHTAVQSLHRRLVSLQHQQQRVPGSDHDIEIDLLIAVRMDNRLIDLVNLTHEFLRKQFDREVESEEHAALAELYALSDQRVRKCLKLSAFYSKVYIDSRDKHVIYHLVVQLEALPSWAVIASQRAGEPTPAGPLAPECELSEVELGWLTSALELACYFTPLAAERLEQLNAGRVARDPARSMRAQYARVPSPSLAYSYESRWSDDFMHQPAFSDETAAITELDGSRVQLPPAPLLDPLLSAGGYPASSSTVLPPSGGDYLDLYGNSLGAVGPTAVHPAAYDYNSSSAIAPVPISGASVRYTHVPATDWTKQTPYPDANGGAHTSLNGWSHSCC